MSEAYNQIAQHLNSTRVNCSNRIKMDASIKMFELIVICPITLFGVLFNATALWVFCCRMCKWTEVRICMINLAMADSILVFTLPFITYFHLHEWPDNTFCEFIYALYCINTPMSYSIITLIALDRYIAIKHPLKAKVLRSPRNTAIICLFLWLGCILFAVTRFAILSFENQEYCFYQTREYSFMVLLYILFFFILLLVLIFCSTQVIRCLKEKQNSSLREEKLTQKALHIISVNMAAFVICFLPFNFILLVRYGADVAQAECWVRNAVNKALSIVICISHLNCCLDAICYYLVAKEFQEAASFLSCFQLKQFRSNFTQDPQLQNQCEFKMCTAASPENCDQSRQIQSILPSET